MAINTSVRPNATLTHYIASYVPAVIYSILGPAALFDCNLKPRAAEHSWHLQAAMVAWRLIPRYF